MFGIIEIARRATVGSSFNRFDDTHYHSSFYLLNFTPRTWGGWKTMPYIIGNEAFEKLAVSSLSLNMVVYLVMKYNMKKVAATNMMNACAGTTSLATLPGAFLIDLYLGRFRAIAIGFFSNLLVWQGPAFFYQIVEFIGFSLLGMSILMRTALMPRLRPSSYSAHEKKLEKCERASAGQFSLLVLFFAFKAIGYAGIRPSNMAFGAEQLEQEGAKGKRRVQNLFNWYYFCNCIAQIVALTVVVYIQSNVSWGIGFGTCMVFMLISTTSFLLGRPVYRHEVPQGIPFTGFVQFRRESLSPALCR